MKSLLKGSLFSLLSFIVVMNPQVVFLSEHAVTSGMMRAQGNSTYTVDRLTDANPTGGGDGSGLTSDLRYALTNARSGDSVTFTVTGTINLSDGLPFLTQNIEVQGPDAGGLTVKGSGTGSVFSVSNGANIVLANMTITGGVGNGGGIFNRGILTLNRVTVSGNRAGDPTNGGGTGAGIWNYTGGILILNNSIVDNNTVFGASFYSPSRGGGIANYGTLTVNNSTVSGNMASEGAGGGISNTLNTSLLNLNNSTVSGNSATGVVGIGGGIDNRGTLNSTNTIIAGNTKGDLQGALNSLGHNLIENTMGGSGFRPDLGDLLNVNPLLDSLNNNGGITQTHALLAGSPAIDHGDDSICSPTDQRSYSRPQDGDGNGIAICDIGAYEFDGIPTSLTVTPIPVDTLTPTGTPSVDTPSPTLTFTPMPRSTDTPTHPVAVTLTSTPVPRSPRCSGAALLMMGLALLMRRSSKQIFR